MQQNKEGSKNAICIFYFKKTFVNIYCIYDLYQLLSEHTVLRVAFV